MKIEFEIKKPNFSFLKNKKESLFWTIVALNVIGFIYGTFFYYFNQLIKASFWQWIFIIDCPLYALLIAISLILIKYKFKGTITNLFYFISVTGALKYGFWTLIVLSFFPNYYFVEGQIITYSILFVAHLLLFLETTLFYGKIKIKNYYPIIAIMWFLLNDVLDYSFALHPALPGTSIGFMFRASIFMSGAFVLIAGFSYKIFKIPLIELFEEKTKKKKN